MLLRLSTFNPALAHDYSANKEMLTNYIFEGLVSESGLINEPTPALAESWEVSEDKLKWTFKLRKDVYWHDGQPFTAEDVVFTFNQIIYNDDIPISVRKSFEFDHPVDTLTSSSRKTRMTVRMLDDHTVEFTLPVPFSPLLRSMNTAIYPEHILAAYIDIGTFTEAWDLDTPLASIVGTGPFTITSYTPDDRLVLTRNPDYWMTDRAGNKLPYLEEVVILLTPNRTKAQDRFLSGDADILHVPNSLFTQLEPLQHTDDFTIHRIGPGTVMQFLTFNMNPESDSTTGQHHIDPVKLQWFTNLQFRRAIALSINKPAIIRHTQSGLGYPSWSYIGPDTNDFHNPDVPKNLYDHYTANDILDALGWIDTNKDGTREDSNGNEIRFTITTTQDSNLRDMAEMIVEDLDHIGIDAGVETLSAYNDLIDRITNTYDWEAVMLTLQYPS